MNLSVYECFQAIQTPQVQSLGNLLDMFTHIFSYVCQTCESWPDIMLVKFISHSLYKFLYIVSGVWSLSRICWCGLWVWIYWLVYSCNVACTVLCIVRWAAHHSSLHLKDSEPATTSFKVWASHCQIEIPVLFLFASFQRSFEIHFPCCLFWRL